MPAPGIFWEPYYDERIKKKLLDNRMQIQADGCWRFLGPTNRWGHAKTTYRNRTVFVHRLSMHLFRGFDLYSPLQINHKPICKHADCFNPDHLYIGTQLDNMWDRSKATIYCIHGHERTEENLFPNGGCRVCNRERKRPYKQKEANSNTNEKGQTNEQIQNNP